MNTYIRALRLPFLTGSLLPVLQAAALAHGDGFSSGLNLLLILIGVGALHSAQSDQRLHRHPAKRHPEPIPTPFSGGSRVILENLLSAPLGLLGRQRLFRPGRAHRTLPYGERTPLCGPYRSTGLVAGLFYSVNPIQFMSRGLGEITFFWLSGR